MACQALSNVDAGRDMLVVEGPVDALDHAAPYFAYGAKVGFDATRKWPGEGVVRPWPDPIVMSDEVRSLVDRRWADYGIEERDVRPRPVALKTPPPSEESPGARVRARRRCRGVWVG